MDRLTARMCLSASAWSVDVVEICGPMSRSGRVVLSCSVEDTRQRLSSIASEVCNGRNEQIQAWLGVGERKTSFSFPPQGANGKSMPNIVVSSSND